MANLTREERAKRNALTSNDLENETEVVTHSTKSKNIINGVECNEHGMAMYDKCKIKPEKRVYRPRGANNNTVELIGATVVGTYSKGHLIPPQHAERMNKQVDWKGYEQQDEFEYLVPASAYTLGQKYHAEIKETEIGIGLYQADLIIDFKRPKN